MKYLYTGASWTQTHGSEGTRFSIYSTFLRILIPHKAEYRIWNKPPLRGVGVVSDENGPGNIHENFDTYKVYATKNIKN